MADAPKGPNPAMAFRFDPETRRLLDKLRDHLRLRYTAIIVRALRQLAESEGIDWRKV